MKFNKNPPTEYQGEEFPTFDKVVTVSTCYYYLSLIERFVSFTQAFSEAELKRYLVRAESRYFKWLMGRTFEKHKKPVPPLDVAYFWHAHMLSPLRYLEDIERLFHNSGKLNYSLPLKEIHESRNGPNKDTLNIWRDIMGSDEPYELTKSTIFNAQDTFISCTMCHIKAKVTWEQFTEWRIDRTIAFKCHFCDAEYSTKHFGKRNLVLDIDRDLHIAGFVLNRENKYDPYNPELVETKTGTLAPSSKINSLPLDAGLDAISKIIEAKQNQPEFLGLNYRKAVDRLDLIETVKSTYFCTPYRSSIDLIMAVARQYKFALKVTREMNWDIPQDLVSAIRSYPSFLRLVKRDPQKITVPTVENDLAWHTHMLHPTAYIQFNRNRFNFFLNHDDTIADNTLEECVEETFDRHRQADIAERTNWELNLMTRKDKLKKFFGKLDRAYYKPQNHFPNDFTEGRYQPPRIKTSRFSSTTTLRVSFELKHSSIHNRRESMYLMPMSYSEEILSKEFQESKTSKFGFIGTSSCGGTNQSLRPIPSENYIPEEGYAGYQKVYQTRGPVPNISTQVKKEIFKKMKKEEKEKNKEGGDTGEEIYDWAETYHALGDIDSTTKKGNKPFDWVRMNHAYLKDDILKQVDVLNKKIQGTMAISLSCYAPTNPYTPDQITKETSRLKIAKQRENEIDKDDESEHTNISNNSRSKHQQQQQHYSTRTKKWYSRDSGYSSPTNSMNLYSIQSVMYTGNTDSFSGHHHAHHHHSSCDSGNGFSSCGSGGGGGDSGGGGGFSSCGGGFSC